MSDYKFVLNDVTSGLTKAACKEAHKLKLTLDNFTKYSIMCNLPEEYFIETYKIEKNKALPMKLEQLQKESMQYRR